MSISVRIVSAVPILPSESPFMKISSSSSLLYIGSETILWFKSKGSDQSAISTLAAVIDQNDDRIAILKRTHCLYSRLTKRKCKKEKAFCQYPRNNSN